MNVIDRIKAVYAWTDRQNNWISAATHAGICAVVITVGLVLEAASYAVEPADPIPFISHFAVGMGFAYTLREIDDARKAIGTRDEGKKLGEGYEDWIAAIVVCVALGVVYSRMF